MDLKSYRNTKSLKFDHPQYTDYSDFLSQ